MFRGITDDIRCVLYLRVSSRKQLDGVSLEDQEHLGRIYAKQQGWTVTHVYVEPGRSAFTEDLAKRVAFQELLSDARRKKFDIVLVYKLNRFARNVPAQYAAAADLERCGVQIASVTEPIERRTASGRATFGMLAVMAQLQSDQLSEKMRDTRAAEARQGRHVGPVPLGFARIESVLVANEQIGAPQLAFQLYATHKYSFATVADALNDAGWRTADGRLFTKFQVEEMLKNPVYVGRVRCNGQVYPGLHDAVIETSIWEAVQTEIARRGAAADHGHREASQPPLLAGLARCSNCGAPMWRGGNNGDYYHCSGRLTHARDPRCTMRGVQAAAAEAHVLLSLIALTIDKTLVTQAANELSGIAALEPMLRPARSIKKIEEQIRRLGRLYEAGMKTDMEFEVELKALQTQHTIAQASTSDRLPNLQDATAMLSDIPTLITRATREECRVLLQEVFDVVYLVPHQTMAVRPAAAYADMLNALDEASAFNQMFVQWAGWGSDRRSDTPYTLLLPRRIATYRGT